MDILLNEIESRVLGALLEKESTTPEYYPLSLNALMNACNQKSSREPVMNLDEGAVRQALNGLKEQNLAGPSSHADGRVTKYEHRVQEVFNLTRRESAILCVLLLRGPQTPGELRGRTERIHPFEDLSEVQSALQRLIGRDPPLAKVLPKQAGTKELRYAHLLCGNVEAWDAEPDAEILAASNESERMARLEDEVAALRKEVAGFKEQLAEIQRRFQ